MRFEVARKRLGRLARGKYYSISYGEDFFKENKFPYTSCLLYIEGMDSINAPTWAEALKKMKEAIGDKLNKSKIKNKPKNEAPKEEKKREVKN